MTTGNPINTTNKIFTGLRSLPRAVFWLGVVLFCLGLLIDFYPGGEPYWFAISATSIAVGLFVQKRGYRIAAIFLLLLSFLLGYDGYQRGVEYRKHLEQRSKDLKPRQMDR